MYTISVFGPVVQAGSTAVSILLAQALAFGYRRSTMLLGSGDSSDLSRFCGVDGQSKDPTRSITQIVKLLALSALSSEELAKIAYSLGDNFKYLNTADSRLKDNEKIYIFDDILDKVDQDFCVIDIGSRYEDDVTQKIFEKSDTILFVLDQSYRAIDIAMDRYKNKAFLNHRSKVRYVFNKFNPEISSLAKSARRMAVGVGACTKVSYNTEIAKAMNEGRMHKLVLQGFNGDYKNFTTFMDARQLTENVSKWLLMSPPNRAVWDQLQGGKKS